MSDFVRESVASYGAEPRRMTVTEYYLAAEKGVFKDDEKLELLRGEVVRMSPQKSPHAWASMNLREELTKAFPKSAFRDHSPFRLDDFNEPEPDVLVAKGPSRTYMKRHPGPADALLVVEVSDSRLRKDRVLKKELYAEFGIPEYWILDLNAKRLEVHREPQRGNGGKADYAFSEILDGRRSISPVHAPDAVIHVGDLLPD